MIFNAKRILTTSTSMFVCLFFALTLFYSCGTQRYYIVRHAERAVVTKDSLQYTAANPPLSEPGQVRAFVLRDELKRENIRHIFSTNFHRTLSTAKPLSESRNDLPIQIYSPSKDSVAPFIEKLKGIDKGNVLVVGHSNTVDDLVNALTGQRSIPGDLKDSDYDNMFIVTKKKGQYSFSQRKFGYPSNPEK